MSERFQLPVAMISVQYHLLGKHSRVLGMSILYASALVVGFLVMLRLRRSQSIADVSSSAIYVITAVQSLFAILGGANAVYRAMLRDYESKMMESHRLTPMTNVSVSLGYTFGSTQQIMALLLVNLAFGSVMTVLADGSLPVWLLGNLLLFSGAITIWTMVVFSGMRLAKPISPSPLLVGVSLLAIPMTLFPGAGLLCGAYSVLLSGLIMTGSQPVGPAAAIVVGAVNIFFAIFWLLAASAKYRRPDLPALNAVRGLAFMVSWLTLATIGILVYDYVTKSTMRWAHEPNIVLGQWIATMIGALLIGAFIMNGAVACGMAVRRGAAPRGWGDRVPHGLVAILITIAICMIMAACGLSLWKNWLVVDGKLTLSAALYAWDFCLVACLTAMLSIRGWLIMVYAKAKKPKYGTVFVFLMLWCAPMGFDLLRAGYANNFQDEPQMSWLFACSPAGTIAAVWADMGLKLLPGILVQAAIAGLLSMVGWRYARKTMLPELVNTAN